MNTLPDLSQLTHEQLLEFTSSWQCSISQAQETSN
jgi:hypothetical protein